MFCILHTKLTWTELRENMLLTLDYMTHWIKLCKNVLPWPMTKIKWVNNFANTATWSKCNNTRHIIEQARYILRVQHLVVCLSAFYFAKLLPTTESQPNIHSWLLLGRCPFLISSVNIWFYICAYVMMSIEAAYPVCVVELVDFGSVALSAPLPTGIFNMVHFGPWHENLLLTTVWSSCVGSMKTLPGAPYSELNACRAN